MRPTVDSVESDQSRTGRSGKSVLREALREYVRRPTLENRRRWLDALHRSSRGEDPDEGEK